MSSAEWFVVAILVLETCAGISYLLQSRWADAIIWFGVATSNVAWVWKMVGAK